MSEKIVQLNEEIIKGQIKELVRGSVEETLNELLEKGFRQDLCAKLFAGSGRMKLPHTILKGDSKLCPRKLYS